MKPEAETMMLNLEDPVSIVLSFNVCSSLGMVVRSNSCLFLRILFSDLFKQWKDLRVNTDDHKDDDGVAHRANQERPQGPASEELKGIFNSLFITR